MIRKRKIRGTNQVKVTFALPVSHPHAKAVVVGDFNNWDPTINKMCKRSNGTYSAVVTLEQGKKYVFRYRDGDFWFNDEAADGYEGENCVLLT